MEVGLLLAERCGYREEGAGREWRFPCQVGATMLGKRPEEGEEKEGRQDEHICKRCH